MAFQLLRQFAIQLITFVYRLRDNESEFLNFSVLLFKNFYEKNASLNNNKNNEMIKIQ